MFSTGNTDFFGRDAMEGRKMGQIGRIAYAGLAMAFVSTPAFAQEGGGLDLVEMFEQMGSVAMGIAAGTSHSDHEIRIHRNPGRSR